MRESGLPGGIRGRNGTCQGGFSVLVDGVRRAALHIVGGITWDNVGSRALVVSRLVVVRRASWVDRALVVSASCSTWPGARTSGVVVGGLARASVEKSCSTFPALGVVCEGGLLSTLYKIGGIRRCLARARGWGCVEARWWWRVCVLVCGCVGGWGELGCAYVGSASRATRLVATGLAAAGSIAGAGWARR